MRQFIRLRAPRSAMTEIERVLQVLIHDARTPIGVAQGYLRLLRDQRLPTDEERDRAMTRTMDALGRLAKLCEQAGQFVGETAETFDVVVPAEDLAARVAMHALERQFVMGQAAIDARARVRVAGGMDQIAEAVGVVLATIGSPREVVPIVQVETRAMELHFTGTPDGQGPAANVRDTPFDPWRTPGLAVALACRAIARSAGRVVSRDRTITIAFPLETHNA
jgi:signal transduction histidine kinase